MPSNIFALKIFQSNHLMYTIHQITHHLHPQCSLAKQLEKEGYKDIINELKLDIAAEE